jgi:sulfite reductase alpha subunit-like flavoprotein
MFCAGSGIAPFRGFWQERKAKMNDPILNICKWGEMILYFGCRRKGLDELYRNEIDQLIKDNVITSYRVAYSRPKDSKNVLFFNLF